MNFAPSRICFLLVVFATSGFSKCPDGGHLEVVPLAGRNFSLGKNFYRFANLCAWWAILSEVEEPCLHLANEMFSLDWYVCLTSKECHCMIHAY